MTSNSDDLMDRAIHELRRKQGLAPLTPEEAEAAYDAAPSVPLSTARIADIVKAATTGARKPVTRSEWSDWARLFPLKDMKRLKFSLPAASSDADALLSFFGVASPDTWACRWNEARVAYRQTQVFDARREAVAAWVREAEIVAGRLSLADFDGDALWSSLSLLRRLTRERIEDALSLVQAICSQVGVAVVVVPELPGSRISGCARWLSDVHALIGLTIRYKADDQFWFTFFHEVGHVLLHRESHACVIDNAAEDVGDSVVDPPMRQLEEEANRFAADTLIPPDALRKFLQTETLTNESIHDFAESIGVGPGIVVGRLQHDKVLQWHQGNQLKQKLDWGFAPEVE